jgi:4,5-DOPA dioxygenase extradiol
MRGAPWRAQDRTPCAEGNGPYGGQALDVMQTASTGFMPTIFLAHGAPLLLDDAGWMRQLRDWAEAMPRPRAILMVSAHWERRPVTLGATTAVPLVYDFYGFPGRYYETKYPAPGAPELAERVKELLGGTQPVAEDPTRGLDHGAYVPLVAMYPAADVPVLQMSIPTQDPSSLMALGRSLAPLRREGVLIVGSGFLVHNLREWSVRRMADPSGRSAMPSWASEFDGWAAEAIRRRDVDALAQYRTVAPGVDIALPTHEHFVPVLVSLGASLDRAESVSFPITGTWLGAFTKRSAQFG